MHLLASAILSGCPLWTLDKRLKQVSLKLGLAYGSSVLKNAFYMMMISESLKSKGGLKAAADSGPYILSQTR
jgi:hypothetical protein